MPYFLKGTSTDATEYAAWLKERHSHPAWTQAKEDSHIQNVACSLHMSLVTQGEAYELAFAVADLFKRRVYAALEDQTKVCPHCGHEVRGNEDGKKPEQI